MLGLDIAELATLTGLAANTLSNIENEAVQPREASLERVVSVLKARGIEFIGDRGVALANDNYRLIEGPDCYIRLLYEVFHTLRVKSGAEVLSICTDDGMSPPQVI